MICVAGMDSSLLAPAPDSVAGVGHELVVEQPRDGAVVREGAQFGGAMWSVSVHAAREEARHVERRRALSARAQLLRQRVSLASPPSVLDAFGEFDERGCRDRSTAVRGDHHGQIAALDPAVERGLAHAEQPRRRGSAHGRPGGTCQVGLHGDEIVVVAAPYGASQADEVANEGFLREHPHKGRGNPMISSTLRHVAAAGSVTALR